MIKRRFFAGILIMVIFCNTGCEKFPDKAEYVPLSLFKFTANGVTDSIVGTKPANPLMDVSLTPITYNEGGASFKRFKLSVYRKNPLRELQYDYRIQFHLTTDNLALGDYVYSYPYNPKHYNFKSETGMFDDDNYSSFSSSDEFKVTITKIEGGLADGTFVGIISNDRCYQAPVCGLPTLQITNGVFKNVPIRL